MASHRTRRLQAQGRRPWSGQAGLPPTAPQAGGRSSAPRGRGSPAQNGRLAKARLKPNGGQTEVVREGLKRIWIPVLKKHTGWQAPPPWIPALAPAWTAGGDPPPKMQRQAPPKMRRRTSGARPPAPRALQAACPSFGPRSTWRRQGPEPKARGGPLGCCKAEMSVMTCRPRRGSNRIAATPRQVRPVPGAVCEEILGQADSA
mmetsp:Transcript_59034/g.185145  ORF Transcript_59034/g.185145 Transcript_59034/m.185145 type:complete len:203 (+) Transcript_59034:1141-1749(+)